MNATTALSLDASGVTTREALGNLLRLGKIAFAPDTPAVRQLVAHLNASHAFFGDHLAGVWPTESAAVAELNKGGKSGLWAIVAMREGFGGGEQDYEDDADASPDSAAERWRRRAVPPPPGDYSAPCRGAPHCSRYAIRMRFTAVPGTQAAFMRFTRVSDAYLRYYTSGFLTIQHAVDNALLRMTAGVAPGDVTTLVGGSGATTSVASSSASAAPGGGSLLFGAPPVPWGVPFPQPALSQNTFYDALGPLLGLLMCMSMLYPLGLLIKVGWAARVAISRPAS